MNPTMRWACHLCGSLLWWSSTGVRCPKPKCRRRPAVLTHKQLHGED